MTNQQSMLNDFGCGLCRATPDTGVNHSNIPFERKNELLNTSHYSLWISECTHCHQLYLEKFVETEWFSQDGEQMTNTWMPISQNENELIALVVSENDRNRHFIDQYTLVMQGNRPVLLYDSDNSWHWMRPFIDAS